MSTLLDYKELEDLLYTLLIAFGYIVIGLINLTKMTSGDVKHRYAFFVSIVMGIFISTYDVVLLHPENFINASMHDAILIVTLLVLKAHFKPTDEHKFLFDVPIFCILIMQAAYAFIHMTAFSAYKLDGLWHFYVYHVAYHFLDFVMMSTLLFCKDYLGMGRDLQTMKRRVFKS